MLVIREEQMEVFKQVALESFEIEMVAHSKEFTPRLCKVLGEEQLRVALRQAMQRAESYGFTNKGPVRFYIDLMFLYGSDFDTDPQYPALSKVLNASGDQMTRAEQIYEEILDYQSKVSGIDNVNVTNVLEALSVLAQKQIAFTQDNFEVTIFKGINHAFPQKVSYIGKEALTKLIAEGRTEAQRYDFATLRGEALIVVLMFALGHGCTNDPLYPWIAQILRDLGIKNSRARANQLEKKAFAWLEYVLNGLREEKQT